MRSTIKAVCIFLLHCCLFFCVSTAAAQEQSRLRITETPFPPYVEGETGGRARGGLAVEIALEAFRRLGIEADIELHPWKRVLRMLETKESDGVLVLMKTEERQRFLIFTETYITGKDLIYYDMYDMHRGGKFSWDNYADLRPFTIGLVEEYSYDNDFLEAIDRWGLKIEYAGNPETNFRKLAAGRVDLVVEEMYVAHALINNFPGWKDRIAAAGKEIAEYPYYMAFSKKSGHDELAEQVNTVLEEMERDRTISEIIKKYTGE